MPGTVVRIAVSVGERVEVGQPLLYLEAMKMQHTVAAPSGGVVTALPVAAGEQVEVDQVLATVAESTDPQEES
jgi:propionyl-CoA carboxylase alpha chain